jgi:hypothetical protein
MAPDPPGAYVVIGLKEIYDAVIGLNATVAALVNQHSEIADDVKDVADDVKDHETRLRGLERNRWPLPAVSAVVSVAALAAAIVPKLGGQ